MVMQKTTIASQLVQTQMMRYQPMKSNEDNVMQDLDHVEDISVFDDNEPSFEDVSINFPIENNTKNQEDSLRDKYPRHNNSTAVINDVQFPKGDSNANQTNNNGKEIGEGGVTTSLQQGKPHDLF